MVDEKLKALIRLELENDGLWNYVDETKSEFLDVGHPYTHLVLNDASKYEQVLERVRLFKLNDARDLECEIHSKWELVDVVYNKGPYYDACGNFYAANIGVTLRSESRISQLSVVVTPGASCALQEITGAAENDYEKHKQDMVDAVQQYIRIRLSGAGRDLWNPLLQENDIKINTGVISWLKSQMAR
jgi:hypothetical protein